MMNASLINDLCKRIRCCSSPGCCDAFLDHPFPPYRNRRSVPIGIVIEHRFAFLYWINLKQKLLQERERTDVTDETFDPPDLITWDWHDDYDGESGFIKDELVRLNQKDEQEVAFFAWAGLQPNNDGQIGPALWLNALGNVYIIQKQKQNCKLQNHVLKDRYGKSHYVYYFRSMKHLPKTFMRTNSGTGVVWDLDLDYFTEGRDVPDRRYSRRLSDDKIQALLSPTAEWMPIILRNLRGITIALEPEYTGGLSVSLELFRQWETALFTAPVFSDKCQWKDGYFA